VYLTTLRTYDAVSLGKCFTAAIEFYSKKYEIKKEKNSCIRMTHEESTEANSPY